MSMTQDMAGIGDTSLRLATAIGGAELDRAREKGIEEMRETIDSAIGLIEHSMAFWMILSALESIPKQRDLNALYLRREEARIKARTMPAELRRLAEGPALPPEALGGILSDADEAMQGATSHENRREIAREVARIKDKMGEALLETHQQGQRDALEGLVGEAERERLKGSVASPDEFREAHRRLVDRVGNGTLSREFFQHKVASGDWPDAGEAARIQRKGGRDMKRMNADYHEFVTRRVMEELGAPNVDEELAEIGQKVIDHALAQSGLTPREAARIVAERMRLEPGARQAVSRAGWPPHEYDKAVLELAQLAGKSLARDSRVVVGSLGEVKKLSNKNISGGRGRAFQIEGDTGNVGRSRLSFVCLTGRTKKRTLFHEVGHAIETVNPLANAMVASWVKRRTSGEEAKSLRNLTGIRTYRTLESAIRDSFIDPYVGKVYPESNGIKPNEALSMGLERLADPVEAGRLAVHDPDHLALVLAALQLEYQP